MRKKISFLPLFACALILISSCKKDDDNNNNNNNNNNPLSQSLGGSPTIPSDAYGALYSVNNHVVYDDGSGTLVTDDVGSGYAWFESYTATKDAGTVTVNTEEIVNNFGGTPLPWYYTIWGVIDFISGGNTATWEVTGNSSTGVAGFTHTDNTAFPKCNFTAPASVNLNNSLTVTASYTQANDAVFFTIYAAGSQKITKSVGAGVTSATFSSAELKSIAASGTQIGIQVMPVKLTPVMTGGKKYYFVKQWAYAQFSTAI